MPKTTWTKPEFEEVNLGSEIGTYYEDDEDPSFLTRRGSGAATPSLERRTDSDGAASRGV